MKRILLSMILCCSPAMAEQTVQQQVYTATATISHAALNLGQRIMDDEAEIVILQKQVADLTKERDDLKAIVEKTRITTPPAP